MLNSLKFHVTAALLALLVLSSGALGYVFLALEHQRANNAVVNLAGRLQLTAQYLSNQAMRYKAHAPRDYDAYYRDLELYYKDLQAHVDTFDMISDAFMHQDFQPLVTGLVNTLRPDLGSRVMAVVSELERVWLNYRRGLFEKLGPDRAEPRLEWGAEFILAHNQRLEQATVRLVDSLKTWAEQDQARVRGILFSVISLGIALSLGVLAWLYRRVLRPIDLTLSGFRQVTQGDFGVQLAETGSNETIQLTRSFNRLSSRLKVLFDLIERLQAGSDLNDILSFLGREFQDLLRVDWVGVLFVTGDGQAIKLEAAYRDGEPEAAGNPIFRLHGTLLQEALDGGRPLHIPSMPATAQRRESYAFLRLLTNKGMRDAIFLPLTEATQSPFPGVLVFAARAPDSYDGAHLDLLNNIAELVTHSFGRTVKLAERTRLAGIGEFASGIAHELRSPLATIGMALEHFDTLELPPSGRKRADLARREAARTGRLLEEILLYARPLRLSMEPLDPASLLRELVEAHADLAEARGQRLVVECDQAPSPVMGDRDRLTQVWLNLTRNALDAAPEDSEIRWILRDHPDRGRVEMIVVNGGEPIAPEAIPRLTEAFYTTKSGGTGLGLAIVKRMVDAHGGELGIESDTQRGTRVTVALPRMAL